jgi:hypothetical protein
VKQLQDSPSFTHQRWKASMKLHYFHVACIQSAWSEHSYRSYVSVWNSWMHLAGSLYFEFFTEIYVVNLTLIFIDSVLGLPEACWVMNLQFSYVNWCY